MDPTGKADERWLAEYTERIETRVAELFSELFPPGSDGPPSGFDIGALYEQATCEVAEKMTVEMQEAIQRDIDRILGNRQVGGEK